MKSFRDSIWRDSPCDMDGRSMNGKNDPKGYPAPRECQGYDSGEMLGQDLQDQQDMRVVGKGTMTISV
jgi:hypothetical protein